MWLSSTHLYIRLAVSHTRRHGVFGGKKQHLDAWIVGRGPVAVVAVVVAVHICGLALLGAPSPPCAAAWPRQRAGHLALHNAAHEMKNVRQLTDTIGVGSPGLVCGHTRVAMRL